MTKPETFCYSFDEERFEGQLPTREDALAEALAEHSTLQTLHDAEPCDVFTGRCEKHTASDFASQAADTLIEQAKGDAYDAADEWAEDWLDDVSHEHREELNAELRAVFDAWAKRNGYEPNFYTVTDVQFHAAEEKR